MIQTKTLILNENLLDNTKVNDIVFGFDIIENYFESKYLKPIG